MGFTPTRLFLSGMIVLAAVFFLPDVADACPNCKKGLGANNMALAYGVSILVMMAMPFALLTGWILFIVRAQNSNPYKVAIATPQEPA